MRSFLLITALIETVLNKLLFSADNGDRQIESARYRLNGKALRLEIKEWSQPINVIFSQRQVDVIVNWAGDVHCTVKAPMATFFKLRNGHNVSELIRCHELYVDGDTQVLQQLIALTELADWDMSDFIAPYLGDIAAYSVSQRMRYTTSFIKNLFNKQQNNVKNAIKEEWLRLPNPLELAYLSERIDELVHELDAIYNRVEKLDSHDDAR